MLLFHHLVQSLAEHGWVHGHPDTGALESGDLLLSASLATYP